MAFYIDMMDFPVEIADKPMRVVCLVPSISLLLYDMGLAERLVGVTKFCVHPKELRSSRTIIGGTKLLDIDKITALKPDLIIANKEENNKTDIETLQENFPVWVSDISSVHDSLDLIVMLGEILKCQEQSNEIRSKIIAARKNFDVGEQLNSRVAYVIWNNPFMAAGNDTFINTMLHEGGWTNAFAEHERYPAFTLDGLAAINPDYLFLSSEPFPFKNKHKALFSSVIPPERIHIVDGEMFSWYGSRLFDSFNYFRRLQLTMKTPIK